MDEKPSILIVDDERENLNLLVNILGDDYLVFPARETESALRILRKRDVRLILTDQRMPGRSGIEFLDEARRVRPDAIRILITAYPDVNVAVDAINRGQVYRYVGKPFDPSELRVIVRQAMEIFTLARSNRKLAEELERQVKELQDLDRLKDHFLSNVSHELKTPLVSAVGYVDLILGGGMGALDDRQKKGLRIAHRNLRRLLALIEDLLALARMRARPDSIRRKPFRLRALIDEAIESIQGGSRKKSLQIRVTVPDDLPLVDGDERRIFSVFMNVLSNAEKFTPDSARVSLRVRKISAERCRVSVVDNGIGVRAVSEFPYFRHEDDAVSKKHGGMGIGLSLAREILAAHGGSIRLGPAGRRGARVTFDLPLARP